MHYIDGAGLRDASGNTIPGALLIPRELSLIWSVDQDTRRPPTYVGSRDRHSDGHRGSALFPALLVQVMMTNVSIAEAKQRMRRDMKSLRRDLDDGFRAAAAGHLADLADAIAGGLPPGVVAGTVAMRGEIDPMPLMQVLGARGWRLALPRVQGEVLSFRAFTFGDRLACGGFGLTEPQPDGAVVIPDLVLVPLLAFDRRGHRLGYGGGFYDRALGRLPGARGVGLGYGMQEVAAVPVEAHDRPLAAIATERGLIDCTG